MNMTFLEQLLRHNLEVFIVFIEILYTMVILCGSLLQTSVGLFGNRILDYGYLIVIPSPISFCFLISSYC